MRRAPIAIQVLRLGMSARWTAVWLLDDPPIAL
jgi:hypothetical protein